MEKMKPQQQPSVIEYVPSVAIFLEQVATNLQKLDEIRKKDHEGRSRLCSPGTPRPSLLKPGAERLLQFYGLGHRPGHGGTDPGAVASGLKEKDLTLDLSKRVEKKLKEKYEGNVRITRTSDKTTSLQYRTDFANKLNAGGGTGFESFVVPNDHPKSAGLLQNNIHKRMSPILKKHGLRD